MDIDDLTSFASSFALPIAEAIEDADSERILIEDLGFVLPPNVTLISSVRGLVEGVVDAVVQLEAFDPATGSGLELFARLAPAFRSTIKGISDIAQTIDANASGSALVTNTDILQVLPRRLLDYLTADFAERELPVTYALLRVIGIIELHERVHVNDPHRVTFTERVVNWERLPRLISEPVDLIKEQYAWDSPEGIHFASLFERVRDLAAALGLRSDLRSIDQRAQIAFDFALNGAGAVPNGDSVKVLRVPFLPIPTGNIGAEVYPVADNAGRVDGFGIGLYVEGQLVATFEITEWLSAQIRFEAFVSGFGVLLRDGQNPKLISTIFSGSPAAILSGIELDTDVKFTYHSPDGSPIILFGTRDATRLQIDSFALTLGFSMPASSALDLFLELGLTKAALIVKASEGDGFLKQVLGDGFTTEFDFSLGFSTQRGLFFSGGAGLEFTLHLDVSVGPIFVNTMDVSLKATNGAIVLGTAVTGGLTLGPLVTVVKGIGIEARLFPGRPGVLGNADMTLGFRPPTGIGLSIDTPAVKAAGFLLIDTERGRYVGALELVVLDKFSLTAIAIITTKMPDGSEGFSLLMIITVTLPVPIPLSYNFYFAGAGGLLGLNRSVDIDRLRDGLRAGTADSILFPTDILRRIDAIVRDLEEVFPPVEGQFLVGPMAMITWSNPPLITIKLGLIIEIGSPIRVAILGVLRAALPNATDPVVDLKVAFLGTIDIAAGLLTFDAAIYDSYIGRGGFKLSFEGDIALRLSWGKQKDFVTSVGGFHPLFKPEAYLHLPQMRRITLSLLKDNPRVQLMAYFAITTNTVQFGARLTFFFSVSSFSILGDFGFDVLFQFSPFHIDAHVWARLAVRSGNTDLLSLSLDFTLQGPTPWIAKGTASFKILFFKVSVEFEKRFGEQVDTTLPDVDVLPRVLTEFNANANWRGELTSAATSLVTVLPITPPANTVVIDAGGLLTVSQRILPLNTDFTLFGTSRPADAQRVTINQLFIGGVGATSTPMFEPFAPAAFRDLSDRDKLKAPAYEDRMSGVQARGGHELRTDYVLARPVTYEVLISDTSVAPQTTRSAGQPEPRATFEALVPGGTIGRSPLSRKRSLKREEGTVHDIGEVKDLYAVAQVQDLRPIGPNDLPVTLMVDASGHTVFPPGVLLARADAEARLNKLVAGGRKADSLQIVPEAQLAA